MADEWIIDVLHDLRSFARKNGLPALASQLDDTMAVAARELGPGLLRGDRVAADDAVRRAGSQKRG